MARYPGATWRPIPEDQTQPSFKKTQLIFHTTASHAKAKNIGDYFAQKGITTESTFVVDLDGTAYQLLDSTRRADANWSANTTAIAVETVGIGGSEAWTDAQLARLEDIARWANKEHGIPLRVCSNAEDAGLGYHSLFPQWNQSHHACPGTARTAQFYKVLLPALKPAPLKPVSTQEVDVPLSNDDVQKIAAAVWAYSIPVDNATQKEYGYADSTYQAASLLRGGDAQGRGTRQAIKDLVAKLVAK